MLIYSLDRYFVDEEVLERVPSLFLFLGFIFVLLEIVALIAIRPPSEKEVEEILVTRGYFLNPL